MQQSIYQQPIAKAFISCSLHPDDQPFVEWIEQQILARFRISSFGTVGKYSAAPTNTAELMRTNIALADIVVVVATSRYVQKDIRKQTTLKTMSEMLQVECGMAYMKGKPIVVFVKEGTDVGNFIPTITQYITLSGKGVELKAKLGLISSLLQNACLKAKQLKAKAEAKEIQDLFKTGLALYGTAKFLESLDD